MEPGDLLGILGQFYYMADIKYDKLKAVGTFMEITETDDGLEYYFETWSDDGEDLIIEGEAETWEEIVEVIEYEYENADSDDTYELFWEMRGKNGYPSGRDEIEEAIKSRKESYKELYDVIK